MTSPVDAHSGSLCPKKRYKPTSTITFNHKKMKKFSLLVAAALVGVSASAKTVYWDNTDTGWTEVIAYS